jgi:hypothetical protein
MRKLRPISKNAVTVDIPNELRESLREVFEVIQQTESDPDRSLGHDDAIQVGAVCGGKYGTKQRPYVLTYYPAGDRKRGRWFLTLHATEIEDIGDGIITAITMYCCVSPDFGSKFREPEKHCFYCDYLDE